MDLTARKTSGQQVHENDIRKHKNDDALIYEPPALKSMGLAGVTIESIADLLKKIHDLDIQAEKQGIHAFVWSVEQMV